jgi:hypothetical protein
MEKGLHRVTGPSAGIAAIRKYSALSLLDILILLVSLLLVLGLLR